MTHNTRTYATLLLAMMAGGIAMSAPVTPEQALGRLGASGQTYSARAKAKAAGKITLAHTAKSASGRDATYIFADADGGYLILPADDMAYPLLGYSDHGTFDADAIPAPMQWWIDEYARQIEYAAEHGYDASADPMRNARRADRKAIDPLITSHWDQIEPFNSMCPYYGTERTWTGCVATSMAQVMNYWKYPERGQGNITYNAETIGKRLTLDFSKRAFDWDNMLSEYYIGGEWTDAQQQAVAYLMKACGYAVQSDYSLDATGALSLYIPKAMAQYFGYDENMSYELRFWYSATEWENLIYTNLSEVGPALIGGGSLIGGGHSFVCDGYDGNGLFHFNWGWSGISDGYFSFDALCPSALGTGGGGGGGYSFTQDAVLGIQPPTGLPVAERKLRLTQMGALTGNLVGTKLQFGLTGQGDPSWVNYNAETMRVKLGAIFEPQGDTPGSQVNAITIDKEINIYAGYGTGPSYFTPETDLATLGLADGVYKVSFASVDLDNDNEYVAVMPSQSYPATLTLRKNGDSYSVETTQYQDLHIVKASVGEPLYYACLTPVSVTVENPTDLEITRAFAPIFFYEDSGERFPFFLGESVAITVPPHGSVTREWLSDLYLMQSITGISAAIDFKYTFFDESSYMYYDGDWYADVTMQPNPGMPTVNVQKFIVTDAPKVRESFGSFNNVEVYLVDDKYHIPVKAKIRNSGSVPYSYTTLACLLAPDWDNLTGDTEVGIETYGGGALQIATGTSEIFDTELNYPFAEEGKYYCLMLAYVWDGYMMPASNQQIYFRLADTSGVDDVISDSAIGTGYIYNLQGVCVGKDESQLPRGIYIRDGKKILK